MRFFPPRALEDARLIYYTPTKKPLENSFKIFIEVLQITTEFTKDLAPFALSTIIGPLCLKKFFLADTLGEQAKLMEMWSSFLTQDILVASLNIKDVVFFAQQPQLFSRQFGLSQLKPYPIMKKLPDPKEFVVSKNTLSHELKKLITKIKMRFHPMFLEKSFHYTKEFYDWWNKFQSKRSIYYENCYKLTPFPSFLQETTKKKKGKLKHCKQISQFARSFITQMTYVLLLSQQPCL